MAETAATVRNVDPVALPSLLFGERASGQCLPKSEGPPVDIVH
jgi:hypothetical protein